ncbi:MAG TPA: hypothetical protein VF017_23680 [Thermoanaerobaculia bacterium]|nr:hypothetical protein [Thermoanaerobaculia bacterium]
MALPNTATGRLHLEVADESGRRRGLTFLPPRVVQGGRALTANYVVEGDTVALVVDGFERALGLTADFEIAFGEVTQDYDAQIDGTGGCVVVRRVASPVHPESSDVLVVRLDREGQLLSTTRVGGRGNDVPLGVAVAADGSLYVTGKTNSQDFPLVRPVQSVNHGGYDAFILQLDPTGKLLLASTYWGGLGDDAGEALSVEAGGSTLLAGRGCLDCARAPADRIGFVTLFPRRVDGERRANYFLARLNTSLDRLFAFERFSAPRLRGRLAVWRGSFGVPVVGIYSQLSLPCNPGTFQTYQMSQLGDLAFDQDDYVNPNTPGNPLNPTATGWGYHALRWKAISNPLISYSNSAATNVPVHSVACNLSEVQLNNAEATSSVFATDPGGSWHCYPHTTQEGLALTAAFYMHRFASPVYARIQFWNSLGSQWVHFPLAIEQVTFCAVGPNPPPKPLHEQCNFDNINPTMINSFCANWTGGHYQLETMSGRSWGQSYLVYYAPSVTLQPDYGQPWYNKWYLPGDYVGDPPAGQGPLAPYLDDAARQLSAALLTQQEVEVTLHPIGGPSRSATLTRLVRPLDLDRESAPVD